MKIYVLKDEKRGLYLAGIKASCSTPYPQITFSNVEKAATEKGDYSVPTLEDENIAVLDDVLDAYGCCINDLLKYASKNARQAKSNRGKLVAPYKREIQGYQELLDKGYSSEGSCYEIHCLEGFEFPPNVISNTTNKFGEMCEIINPWTEHEDFRYKRGYYVRRVTAEKVKGRIEEAKRDYEYYNSLKIVELEFTCVNEKVVDENKK